jgi:hypothetical protein
MAEDLAAMRRQLAAYLPGCIAAAMSGYESFAQTPPPDDAKGFAGWHAAAKAALAHVDQLVKLARWAEGAAAGESAEDGIAGLLSRARAALAGLDEDEDEDEDEVDDDERGGGA